MTPIANSCLFLIKVNCKYFICLWQSWTAGFWGFFSLFVFSSWLLLGGEVVHYPSGFLRSTFPVVPKMCHFHIHTHPPSPAEYPEVFQSATCFLLIFDSNSELQFDRPHQLLGILFRMQLTQRVNCCTDVWCRKFNDVWFPHSDLLALKIFFVLEPRHASCQFGFVPI